MREESEGQRECEGGGGERVGTPVSVISGGSSIAAAAMGGGWSAMERATGPLLTR